MDQSKPAPYRVSLPRVVGKGLRAAYDHLGYVVFVSFAAFVGTAGLFAAGTKAALAARHGMAGMVFWLPAGLFAHLFAVGVFYFAGKSVYHEHPSLADTWVGVRALMRPALALLAVDAVITVVLAGDAAFFLGAFGPKRGLVFGALGILCAYLTLVWLMMVTYHLPLLAAQLKMESGTKVGVILRKSFLLTADNPGFTVGLFLAIIALAVLCAIPALIGMAMLFLGAVAFLLTHALRELFVKYGIVGEEPEVAEDRGWPR